MPRLRMFAGPNGSGKSTMKDKLLQSQGSHFLGVYINADDIEKAIRQNGHLELTPFKITTDETELRSFLSQSVLLAKQDLLDQAKQLVIASNTVYFNYIAVNSYFASVLVDFIRQKLLAAKISFSFETVMSSKQHLSVRSD